MLHRVTGGIFRGITVFSVTGDRCQTVKQTHQRLLAREVTQDPSFTVLLPYGRLQSICLQTVHEQRRVLLAVRVAPTTQYALSERFCCLEVRVRFQFRARGKPICFTDSTTDAVDLGRVEADQSINWLQNHIYPVSELSQEAIILISLHAGELPVDILEQLLAVETD